MFNYFLRLISSDFEIDLIYYNLIFSGRWAVGQNLYTSFSSASSKAIDWNGAIQSWFDEHKVYKFSTAFSAATGHYTQVMFVYNINTRTIILTLKSLKTKIV